jgi:deoxyribodipyrimidine photo-lyase
MTNNIWWIRRDLRLHDNPALDAALHKGQQVIPLFIIDPALWRGAWFSPRRAAFLVDNLRALDEELRKRGSYLVIRRGKPGEVLEQFTTEQQANQIFAERDYSPYAIKRDTGFEKTLPLTLVGGTMLHPPDQIQKSDGTPYVVYTPFMRQWKDQPLPSPFDILPAPAQIPTPPGITSEAFPDIQPDSNNSDFPAGEAEALRRLEAFSLDLDAPIFQYAQHRDRPDLNATSQLSPYLRFGLISIRQAVVTAQVSIQSAREQEQLNGAETWLNELIWREFYQYILYHYPYARKKAFKPKYRQIPWVNDTADFDDWKNGRTGYPLVDAAMRQLAQTGWMHNRARMITASFLVKNLMVDWRWGEAWFMQNLIDGDPAANNGGWQWTAGTGTDAAPYFRIFNPVTQSKNFDPQGDYIRRWLPELQNVPDKFIHAPWEMDKATQTESECVIGEDYPAPIIDLKFSRQRALDLYKQATSKSTVK